MKEVKKVGGKDVSIGRNDIVVSCMLYRDKVCLGSGECIKDCFSLMVCNDSIICPMNNENVSSKRGKGFFCGKRVFLKEEFVKRESKILRCHVLST